MPQGALKKASGSKGVKKQQYRQGKPQPKKTTQIVKKATAARASLTEKFLASKVGHLELLKGTRRELEKKEREKKQKETAKAKAKEQSKPTGF